MNKQNFDPVDINDEYFKKLAENELKNQDIDNLDDAEPEEDYQDINEDSESDAKAITITCSQLNNVNEIGTVSAVSYNGIGIITSIVLYFVEFFGCGSDMYANKILRAERSARRKFNFACQSFESRRHYELQSAGYKQNCVCLRNCI